MVKVTGTSKGRGFQGVMKRHGFKGSKATHGNKDQSRMPGSIGATGPAHVFKGTKMAGQMGNKQITLANLEIIEAQPEDNILLIKGAVPGGRNGLLYIKSTGKVKEQPQVQAEESKAKTQAKETRQSAGEGDKKAEDKSQPEAKKDAK